MLPDVYEDFAEIQKEVDASKSTAACCVITAGYSYYATSLIGYIKFQEF